MTTIRGTVKDGQLVFPAEVTEAVIAAARVRKSAQGNPFTAWMGSLPSLPEGHDAVSFTGELRGSD